jgi:hypothetical protein
MPSSRRAWVRIRTDTSIGSKPKKEASFAQTQKGMLYLPLSLAPKKAESVLVTKCERSAPDDEGSLLRRNRIEKGRNSNTHAAPAAPTHSRALAHFLSRSETQAD